MNSATLQGMPRPLLRDDLARLHPAVQGLLRHFRWAHLPPHLRAVSAPFALAAVDLAVRSLEGADGPETTTALRHLLEAKDAAVRRRSWWAATGALVEPPKGDTFELVLELLRTP